MAENPFRQLTVVRKVAQKNKQVKDCYRLLYHKALWLEVKKKLPNTHTNKREKCNDWKLDVYIDRLKHYPLEPSHFKQQSKEMNELLQQVVCTILQAIFEQPSNPYRFTSLLDHPDKIIRTIQQIKTPLHASVTIQLAPLTKQQFASVQLFIKQTITDHRFLRLVQLLYKHIERTKEFLSRDLVTYLQHLYLHKLDQWIVAYKKQLVYYRYDREVFIGIYKGQMDGATFNKDLQAFLKRHEISFQTYQYRLIRRENIFLGYAISKKQPITHLSCQIPKYQLQKFTKQHHIGHFDTCTSTVRPYLLNLSEAEIIQVYNREIIQFAHSYRLADNFHCMRQVLYITRHSLLKTIAKKRKTTIKKVKLSMINKQTDVTILLPTKKKSSFITYQQLQVFVNRSAGEPYTLKGVRTVRRREK